MALQIRRGLNTDRLTITPAAGELIYTTDTKNLYVGDGSTAGGNIISGGGGGGGATALSELTDVALSSPAPDEVLKYNGTDWVNSTVPTAVTYSIQADTETGGASLSLIGTDSSTDTVTFVEGANITITRTDASTIEIAATGGGGGGASNLNDLGDVVITGTPNNNEVLQFDSGTGKWINNSLSIPSGTLSGLSDVDVSTLITGDTLVWDGTNWVSTALVQNLSDLGDVDFTQAPALDNILKYDGTNWIPSLDLGITALHDDSSPALGADLDLFGFDIGGVGNINISGDVTANTFYGDLSGNASSATSADSATLADTATAVAVTDSADDNSTYFVPVASLAVGSVELKTDESLTFNPSTNVLNVGQGGTGQVKAATLDSGGLTITGPTLTSYRAYTPLPTELQEYASYVLRFGGFSNPLTLFTVSDTNLAVNFGLATGVFGQYSRSTTNISRGTLTARTAVAAYDGLSVHEGKGHDGTQFVVAGEYGLYVDNKAVTTGYVSGLFGVTVNDSVGDYKQLTFNSDGLLTVKSLELTSGGSIKMPGIQIISANFIDASGGAGTYVMSTSTSINIFENLPTGSPSLTITLPSSPVDGQICELYNASSNGSIIGSITGGVVTVPSILGSFNTNGKIVLTYRASQTKWYRC
jgi:hypothetical protein